MATAAVRYRDLALLVLVPLFFSTNVVLGRAVVAEVAPWTLAFLRWSGAFLIVLPFSAASLRASAAALRAQASTIGLLAFLGMWVCGGVVYLALHHTTATNATLIYATANVLILVLEWAFRNRRIGAREFLGTVLALGGVAVVARGSAGAAAISFNPGDLLIAGAAIAWAVYSVMLKRPGLTAIPGLALFAVVMLVGAAMLAPMMAWEVFSGPALPQTARAWLAVAAVALIPSVGAFFGYQYGVRRFGPATMAMTAYLWTPFGILLAVLFLGEALQSHHLVGPRAYPAGRDPRDGPADERLFRESKTSMSDGEPIDLEAQYDNRANVPEHPAIMAGWARDAAAYRSARARYCELNLPYGGHPRQTVDLFHPDRPDPGRPLILFIHGGYWRSLHPSSFSHLAAGANAAGFSVAMPGYRLCPEATIADIIEDLRAACLFLHTRHRLPLVACGHSAGGHLAAALAATEWTRFGPDVPPALLRHGLAVSGLFDLAPLLLTSVNDSLRLDAISARAASPAFWAVPAGVQLEAWVGGAETADYHRQSRMLAERWAAAGAHTRWETIPGANHFTAPAALAEPGSTMVKALVRLAEAAGERPGPARSSAPP